MRHLHAVLQGVRRAVAVEAGRTMVPALQPGARLRHPRDPARALPLLPLPVDDGGLARPRMEARARQDGPDDRSGDALPAGPGRPGQRARLAARALLLPAQAMGRGLAAGKAARRRVRQQERNRGAADRDVALGILEPGDRIVARERLAASGLTVEVEKVRPAA